MSRLAVLPLAAVVVLGMTACDRNGGSAAPGLSGGNGGKAGAQAPAKLELCGVLTADRAKQLIGDGATADDNTPTECSFRDDNTGYSVNLKAENDANGSQWDIQRKVGGAAEQVSGLGDDAFYHPSLYTLYVHKGSTILTVQVVTSPTKQDGVLDQEKQLAADILAK